MQVATLTCTPSKLPLFLLPPPYNTLPPPVFFGNWFTTDLSFLTRGGGRSGGERGGRVGGWSGGGRLSWIRITSSDK